MQKSFIHSQNQFWGAVAPEFPGKKILYVTKMHTDLYGPKTNCIRKVIF